MRLSISTKIFVAFAVVLATFGLAVTYGALTMRHLGDELQLVSRGYLDLRLQLGELYTAQTNLLKELEALGKEGPARARLVKPDLDAARRIRLMKIPHSLDSVRALEALRAAPEEHALLNRVRMGLEAVQRDFAAEEEPFDAAFGPIGDLSLLGASPETTRPAREQLWRQEEAIRKRLSNLSTELKVRSQQAELRLESEENRAVWATLLLALVALAVGAAVMMMATRVLRPLRTLAERAREIARGDYQKRVDASTHDEIGALGREFNAMAAALDEREQLLIRSERLAAVGKIAAQITHEVRNPLSSIGLNAELLEEELQAMDGPLQRIAEAKSLTRAIVKEVDRLTEITEEYLRLARLPRPRIEHEDLAAIVSSLLEFLRPELQARQITVEAQLDPALQVAADEQQLRQALLNLLRNASEAMPSGGRLTVSARAIYQDGHSPRHSLGEADSARSARLADEDGHSARHSLGEADSARSARLADEDGHSPRHSLGEADSARSARLADARTVELRISDTGEGIAPEHLPKIFDAFFSTKEGGTGLGLALTQQIIVAHGGHIDVESQVGIGTTFVLRLHATPAPARAVAAS